MPRLPEQLLNSLSQLEHFNREAFIEAHLEENRVTSIRLNPFKKTELDFPLNKKVGWHEDGYYLDVRPSFTMDPLFHAGCYYVQEAGSMFLEFALKQVMNFKEKQAVLDICAAPGGKSTLVNSLLSEESLLVSNDIIKSRADVLAQNLSKWGTCNTIVTNNETAKFGSLPSFFDAIILDAPCSGSGLFRKQPDAIDEWSEAHVMSCSQRQKSIASDILPSLKENGILFYSTCSYSVAENEEIVKWLISEQEMEFVPLSVQPSWGVVSTGLGYRFYPHLTESEGFFCAVLRKKGQPENRGYFRKKNAQEITKTEHSYLEPFLKVGENKIIKINNQFHLLNEVCANFLSEGKHFYFKKAGVVVGELKGKDLVPNHELALSLNVHENIATAELSKETAIQYLRKENFVVDEKHKGFSLITHKRMGLGWAKILPNRINNYLPNELRILK